MQWSSSNVTKFIYNIGVGVCVHIWNTYLVRHNKNYFDEAGQFLPTRSLPGGHFAVVDCVIVVQIL
jgi:hypothetical protein